MCGRAAGYSEVDDLSSAEIIDDFIETYPRYKRISEVAAAGERAIRYRRGMGAMLWAEWLAFMEARGLEWDEVRKAPAGSLPSDWNVVAFPPKGEECSERS